MARQAQILLLFAAAVGAIMITSPAAYAHEIYNGGYTYHTSRNCSFQTLPGNTPTVPSICRNCLPASGFQRRTVNTW